MSAFDIAHARLLRVAIRVTRHPDEAEDLVQDALLIGLAAARRDLADARTVRWLAGVIRKRALFVARSGVRRRRREARWSQAEILRIEGEPHGDAPAVSLAGLPASLRVIAALALAGLDKREILSLLGLTDTAFRQRLVALRRQLRRQGAMMPGTSTLSRDLEHGKIRNALVRLLGRRGGAFASHDPDGHLFIVRRTHISVVGGNT